MADERFLAQLWATIESRKADLGQTESYTRQLLSNPPRPGGRSSRKPTR